MISIISYSKYLFFSVHALIFSIFYTTCNHIHLLHTFLYGSMVVTFYNRFQIANTLILESEKRKKKKEIWYHQKAYVHLLRRLEK